METKNEKRGKEDVESGRGGEGNWRLTVSYSCLPPRATQKKFSGSEPSCTTTLEKLDCVWT